jgi:hypothetical protein
MELTMQKKYLTMLGVIALSCTPFTAFADVTIQNNTNSPATAIAGLSPCSNAAGEKGVIKPHGKVTIPDFLVGMYCTNDCKAHVYMSKNCSGKSIATVTANKREGVKLIENEDKTPGGYHLEGGGSTITIEGGPSRGLFDWLFG